MADGTAERVPIIAIGGSAGALEALLQIVPTLPADLGAAVLVAIHIPPDQPSRLPEVLSRHGPLPASAARDGEEVQPGHIYTAVPDRHLLLDGGRLRLGRGPRENRSRPSLDALLRSVALSAGPDALGLLLSGMLDDGASGLWALRWLGGSTMVQHPDDALYPSIPLSGLRSVEVNDILPTDQIGPALVRWSGAVQTRRRAVEVHMDEAERGRLEEERDIAAGVGRPMLDLLGQGQLTPFTCPECHGVLVRFKEGHGERFRCHTGHAYSLDTLLAELRVSAEAALWQTARVLDEQLLLLRHLQRHLDDSPLPEQARQLAQEAQATGERARLVRQLAQEAAAPAGEAGSPTLE